MAADEPTMTQEHVMPCVKTGSSRRTTHCTRDRGSVNSVNNACTDLSQS